MDKRELIILRLEALLATVSGITAVYRDRGELPDGKIIGKLPAVILLDGREARSELTPNKISGHVQMPPGLFTLFPQIFVVLKPRDTLANETLNKVAAPVGPELSAYRVKVLKAILNDDTLIALVGPNGQIDYVGHDTDMQTGSTLGALGAMIQFHFSFTYVLKPSDL